MPDYMVGLTSPMELWYCVVNARSQYMEVVVRFLIKVCATVAFMALAVWAYMVFAPNFLLNVLQNMSY